MGGGDECGLGGHVTHISAPSAAETASAVASVARASGRVQTYEYTVRYVLLAMMCCKGI